MKDESGGQIMKEFVGLRAKTHSYLKDNNDEEKKAKGTKKCFMERNLKLVSAIFSFFHQMIALQKL